MYTCITLPLYKETLPTASTTFPVPNNDCSKEQFIGALLMCVMGHALKSAVFFTCNHKTPQSISKHSQAKPIGLQSYNPLDVN